MSGLALGPVLGWARRCSLLATRYDSVSLSLTKSAVGDFGFIVAASEAARTRLGAIATSRAGSYGAWYRGHYIIVTSSALIIATEARLAIHADRSWGASGGSASRIPRVARIRHSSPVQFPPAWKHA